MEGAGQTERKTSVHRIFRRIDCIQTLLGIIKIIQPLGGLTELFTIIMTKYAIADGVSQRKGKILFIQQSDIVANKLKCKSMFIMLTSSFSIEIMVRRNINYVAHVHEP